MKDIMTAIIGAGQSGLAMSKHLAARGIDHVVLERGQIANSWLTERWDSLRLLTPNWQSRLPGYAYTGVDPDGYMTMPEVANYLQSYATGIAAPVHTGADVKRVSRTANGYLIETDRDVWTCRCVVIASGACNIPIIPAMAKKLPASIASVTPFQYRAPSQLRPGGVMVVGASATGIQLAREIRASGRDVILCVGEHVRLPRLYRGRDIKWWMDAMGMMDVHYNELDDLERARRLPSLQLIGTPERQTLDLNMLQGLGVRIVGKLVAISGNQAQFSGSLHNVCALADLKMNRLLEGIDGFVASGRIEGTFEAPYRYSPTRVASDFCLGLDLRHEQVTSVIWATGFRPDYQWLDVPVLDQKGHLRHDGGVVASPGMYVMGLPFMRRRKSSFIDGAADDARDLAEHMWSYLAQAAA